VQQLQHLLKMEPIECSETSVFTTQMPGKYPEDNSSCYDIFGIRRAVNYGNSMFRI